MNTPPHSGNNEYIFSSFQRWPWPPGGAFLINNTDFHYYRSTNVPLAVFVLPTLIQAVIIIYRSTGGPFHQAGTHTLFFPLPRRLSSSARRVAWMDQRVDVGSGDGLLCLSEKGDPPPPESGPLRLINGAGCQPDRPSCLSG